MRRTWKDMRPEVRKRKEIPSLVSENTEASGKRFHWGKVTPGAMALDVLF